MTPDTSSLPYSPVDIHSPIPLYHQIYLDLRRMIQDGIIPTGGMLPPEIEISEVYNVGRQTVRQAIARLVDDDLLERYAGRGTFVRAQPSHTQFFLDRSFSQQMRELGRVPHSQVLSIESSTIDSSKIPALQGYNGCACLTLERLRLGDEEPVCHQVSTILTENCPGIEQQDLANQSMYEILATLYHLVINRIDHVVRATAADEYRADLLKVAEGTPLLFVGTTTYLDTGQVIEHTASYYRADKYEYSTSQTCCE
jgi:GntR family transcriptional regulator